MLYNIVNKRLFFSDNCGCPGQLACISTNPMGPKVNGQVFSMTLKGFKLVTIRLNLKALNQLSYLGVIVNKRRVLLLISDMNPLLNISIFVG